MLTVPRRAPKPTPSPTGSSENTHSGDSMSARVVRRAARSDSSPHPDCKCGIYAYHRPGTQAYFGEWLWLEGIVTVWGRIEAHRDGLRAQHARGCALARRPGVAAIADELGVDLVERDELESAAGRYGAPLPAGLVP